VDWLLISVGALLAHNCTFTYNIPSSYTQYYTTELFYLDTNPQNCLTLLDCLLVQSAGLVISGNTSIVMLVNTTVVLYNNTNFTNEQAFSASKIFGCSFWSSCNDTIIFTDRSLVINTTFSAFGEVMGYPIVSIQGDSYIPGTVSFEKTFFGDSTISILEGTVTLFDCPFSPRNQTLSIDIMSGVLRNDIISPFYFLTLCVILCRIMPFLYCSHLQYPVHRLLSSQTIRHWCELFK
jgi:hypothetical protein